MNTLRLQLFQPRAGGDTRGPSRLRPTWIKYPAWGLTGIPEASPCGAGLHPLGGMAVPTVSHHKSGQVLERKIQPGNKEPTVREGSSI